MSLDRRRFLGWFLALIASFIAANMVGLVRPMGLKPFRIAGFPLTIVGWGVGGESAFDGAALAFDLLVAVSASGLVAWLFSRNRSAQDQNGRTCNM